MTNITVNTTIETTNDQFVQKSVLEFKGYARKTAENVLEMGRVVFETKNQLKKDCNPPIFRHS